VDAELAARRRHVAPLVCVSGIRLISESRTLVAGGVELQLMLLGLAVPWNLLALCPVLVRVAGTTLRRFS
jgi:hypothetical protein